MELASRLRARSRFGSDSPPDCHSLPNRSCAPSRTQYLMSDRILSIFVPRFLFNLIYLPAWWNWQTSRTQNPVVAIPCGFDPRRRHQKEAVYCFFFYGNRKGVEGERQWIEPSVKAQEPRKTERRRGVRRTPAAGTKKKQFSASFFHGNRKGVEGERQWSLFETHFLSYKKWWSYFFHNFLIFERWGVIIRLRIVS